MNITWVDELIGKLESTTEGVLSVKVGDQTLQAFISDAAINFFKENKPMLINIGKSKFKDFIWLISERKQEEAFVVLLKGMDADAILNRMRMNVAELQAENDRRDAFIAALKKFIITTLTSAASKIILAALL